MTVKYFRPEDVVVFVDGKPVKQIPVSDLDREIFPCIYCKQPVEKVTGKEIYPHREDLWRKIFYRCRPCNAYVGTHPDGRPLGNVAGQRLRSLRQGVHAMLDPLWKRGWITRKEAYRMLANMLGIHVDDCHVGHFREEMCEKALKVLQAARESSGGNPGGNQAAKNLEKK